MIQGQPPHPFEGNSGSDHAQNVARLGRRPGPQADADATSAVRPTWRMVASAFGLLGCLCLLAACGNATTHKTDSSSGSAPTFNASGGSAAAAVKAINAEITPAGSGGNPNATCDLYPGTGSYQVMLVIEGADATAICSSVGNNVYDGIAWSTTPGSFPTPGKHVHNNYCNSSSTQGADGFFINFMQDAAGGQNSFVVCGDLTNSNAWQANN